MAQIRLRNNMERKNSMLMKGFVFLIAYCYAVQWSDGFSFNSVTGRRQYNEGSLILSTATATTTSSSSCTAAVATSESTTESVDLRSSPAVNGLFGRPSSLWSLPRFNVSPNTRSASTKQQGNNNNSNKNDDDEEDDDDNVVRDDVTDLVGSANDNDVEAGSVGGVGDLPPVIQQIADERRLFQVNLGKAMDTLRHDMMYILHEKPDFSIYDDKINVVDPSGVQLTGLDKYKSAFAFFQTFLGFWFHTSAPDERNGGANGMRSTIQYRMAYDFCRSSIRISWNAVLVPKVPLMQNRPVFVDGVSYYTLHRATGKIVEHRVEKLVINQNPVQPPYGILSLLQQDDVFGAIRGGRGVAVPGIPAGVGTAIAQQLRHGWQQEQTQH